MSCLNVSKIIILIEIERLYQWVQKWQLTINIQKLRWSSHCSRIILVFMGLGNKGNTKWMARYHRCWLFKRKKEKPNICHYRSCDGVTLCDGDGDGVTDTFKGQKKVATCILRDAIHKCSPSYFRMTLSLFYFIPHFTLSYVIWTRPNNLFNFFFWPKIYSN